jgi:hypothetical protein
VTKQYVDGLALNLGRRQRVRAATTANIAIATALNNGDAIDGVTLVTGDQVLVKNQTAPAENGVYVVGVTPARAAEFDAYNEHPGSIVSVAEGTTNVDTLWLCTSNDGGTLGTTGIVWSTFNVAGALLQASNLSDLTDTAAAKVNLLGTAAAALVSATPSADRVPYYVTSTTAAVTAFTGGGRNLVGTAGTTDTFPYFSAPNVHSLAAITAAGRAILDDADAAAQRTTLAAAARTQTLFAAFYVPTVADGDVVRLAMEHDGTVTAITTQAVSGTCTLTGKVNATNLGGTANSASTTKTTQAHASANTFVDGDNLVFTASANSACAGLSITVAYQRTLA